MAAELESLSPCPFCGGEGKLWECAGHYYIECERCWVHTPGDTKAAAISTWNRRATLPAQEVTDAIKRGITATQILLQNSISCVELHHGRDTAANGLPPWLEDCQRDVLALAAALNELPHIAVTAGAVG